MPEFEDQIKQAFAERENTIEARKERGLARYSKVDRGFYLADSHLNIESKISPETGVRGRYFVSLDDGLQTPARVLEWFAHLSDKIWFTPQMFADLWAEFEIAAAEHGMSAHQLPDRLTWQP